MKKYTYAAEFCRETGYPLRDLKRLLNAGIIPHKKEGRKYRIDTEWTQKILDEILQKGGCVNESVQGKKHSKEVSISDFRSKLKKAVGG